ncbi:ABC transporter permease [Clostridium sp. D2Q-11]|uniref:ABC transporter permease n=1 Tax=Anaeromonas frigoriresistens TaxID=2683708 RepID=A0A942Z8V2_9FIRM|nr:ABC transporter permease [Anaeromonas frigoriresistens]MBS4538389.1 ABC transporter permease [Anaeromonas frigoriresistens]
MRVLNKLTKYKSIYGFIIILILWYILHKGIDSSIVPSPYETIIAFINALINGSLLLHLLVSLLRIVSAVSIAMIIGIPMGLWMGSNSRADAIISPVTYLLYPIPKIAFLPVFMLLFGLGNLSKIVLIITIIFFQVLLATRDGVKEIPTNLIYSVKSLGLNHWQTYLHLVIPSTLPKIISALRISVGISISVLFFAENFATTYGIGYYIMNSWAIVQYKEMFAGILGLSLMSYLIFKIIDLIEGKVCAWMFVGK